MISFNKNLVQKKNIFLFSLEKKIYCDRICQLSDLYCLGRGDGKTLLEKIFNIVLFLEIWKHSLVKETVESLRTVWNDFRTFSECYFGDFLDAL